MKAAARGLRELVPDIDLLATSPFTRAAQTAAILDSVYGGLKEVEIDELAPGGSPQAFLSWLKRQKADTVAVVGHEPGLSRLAAWLLTGAEASFLTFRKGGAALLELTGPAVPGDAKLLWMLVPSQLRTLGT
jgi:phosphohistidine phosphatase